MLRLEMGAGPPELSGLCKTAMTQTRPDKSQRFPWNTFLGGKWVRTQPTKPGKYFCATREGNVVGLREWRLNLAGKCVDAQVGPNEPGWCGWIWSMAIPDAPNAPVPLVWEEAGT